MEKYHDGPKKPKARIKKPDPLPIPPNPLSSTDNDKVIYPDSSDEGLATEIENLNFGNRV